MHNPPPVSHVPTAIESRRRLLRMALGMLAPAELLTACGGGSASSTAATSGTTTGTTTGTTATGTSTGTATGTTTGSSTGSTTGSTTTSSIATDPWSWRTAGTSTAASLPSMAEFVTVIASGTIAYNFHTSTTSSTTDPVTGVLSDTSSVAILQPYLMGKYLVSNANWKAFCNAQGSSYYPSTAKTAGQYWYGGSYPAGKEQHPVLFVSLTAATAYCAWLATQIPGYHFYVPTEGEWEYAALGNNTSYSFPWGANAGITYNSSTGALSTVYNCNAVCSQYVLNSAAFTTVSYYNDSVVTTLNDGSTALTNDTALLSKVLSMNASGGVTGWQYDSTANSSWADFANTDQFRALVNLYGGYTSPAGTYEGGKSWCGCYDMAGNAYEWTTTLNLASNGAEAGTSVNVVKGGSWYATSNSGKSTGRGEGRSAAGAYHSVGFRIAARLK
ncbi:formylglycine-generating enzyme family protein [Undibacterium sp. Ji83W]|uniref:formylglycine-generating enzyme family protein n=1 Tax=Undibacterium sp. Ji83W TaxID=3413043 RepID=UPI003BEFA2EC